VGPDHGVASCTGHIGRGESRQNQLSRNAGGFDGLMQHHLRTDLFKGGVTNNMILTQARSALPDGSASFLTHTWLDYTALLQIKTDMGF
jgi:hypothetical protein